MRNLSLKQFSKEQVVEMSLIEIAYELLVEKNESILFDDLVNEIAELKGSSKADIIAKISQFYTDLNVDGRFTSLGGNRWGLKTWYPVDQVEEEVVHTTKVKKKKKSKKAASLLDEDLEDLDLDDEDLDLDEEDLDDLEDDLDDSDEDILDDNDLLDDDVEEDDDIDDELIEDEIFDLDDEEEEDEDLDLDEEEEKK